MKKYIITKKKQYLAMIAIVSVILNAIKELRSSNTLYRQCPAYGGVHYLSTAIVTEYLSFMKRFWHFANKYCTA